MPARAESGIPKRARWVWQQTTQKRGIGTSDLIELHLPSPANPATSGHGGFLKNQNILQTLSSDGDLRGDVGSVLPSEAPASAATYLALLRACTTCKDVNRLSAVRSHIAVHGVEICGLLGDHLVLSLAKCGAVSDAHEVCRGLRRRNVVSCTAIISAYADCCCGMEAIDMFQCMQQESIIPNSYTFVGLLKACGNGQDIRWGKRIHALAHSQGLASTLFVGNTLVSMYGKCAELAEATWVFTSMSEHDVVSWNAMISAYIDQDKGKLALLLYRQMQEESKDSTLRTLLLALQACGAFVEEMGPSVRKISLEIGQALHALGRSKGYTSDAMIGTTLLHMYGNCGAVSEAEDMFASLGHHDIVSWTALLSVYLDEGFGKKLLNSYRQMHVEGISPNDITFGIVLQAICQLSEEADVCSNTNSATWILEVMRAMLVDIDKIGLTTNFVVGNHLLNMFGKFPSGIPDAECIFEALVERDTVSWNTMLSMYVLHCQPEKALYLFIQMRNKHIPFADITLVAILQNCSELGSLAFCRRLHFDACSCGFDHKNSVAATLVHAYGSCGSTIEAQAILDGLSEPHIVSWNACVAGHAQYGNHEFCMLLTNKLMLAGNMPNDATLTSILTSCSHSGLIEKGSEYLHYICTDYKVVPDVKHYGIMVDLLGRAGDFKHVQRLLDLMTVPADLTLWLCLLSACRAHGNFTLARNTFDQLLHLEPEHGAAYVLLANIYADSALEDDLYTAE